MDGFKTLPKMQCFKTGGHAKSEAYCGGGKAMKKGGEVDDEKQDKALIKKAFKQHDEAEHDKEPTEIKLKKGGRSKKEAGTVKKFKAGGAIYGAKKDSKDLKSIEEAKESKPKMIKAGGKLGSDVAKEKSKPAGDAMPIIKVKPTGNKKADAPNKAAIKPSRLGKENAIDDMTPFKKGGKIKKFQVGGLTGPMDNAEMERRKRMQAGMATLSPDMLRQLQQQMPPSQQQAAGMGMQQQAAGMGGMGMQQMPPQGMPGQLPPGMGQ